MPPVVCAVMVTGKPGREPLARLAVEAFVAQDYTQKKLLIVNDGEPLRDLPDGVRQLEAPPGLTLGGLRNLALKHIDKDVRFVVQWDDDDHSRSDRLHWQVKHTLKKPRSATVFLYEAHCNLINGESFVCRATRSGRGGFPGTVMHPIAREYRYEELGKGEDTRFIRAWRKANRLDVLVNDPLLYVRFFHGLNTWSVRHVMMKRPGSRDVTPHEARVIERVRQRYLAAMPSVLTQHHAVAADEPDASAGAEEE